MNREVLLACARLIASTLIDLPEQVEAARPEIDRMRPLFTVLQAFEELRRLIIVAGLDLRECGREPERAVRQHRSDDLSARRQHRTRLDQFRYGAGIISLKACHFSPDPVNPAHLPLTRQNTRARLELRQCLCCLARLSDASVRDRHELESKEFSVPASRIRHGQFGLCQRSPGISLRQQRHCQTVSRGGARLGGEPRHAGGAL